MNTDELVERNRRTLTDTQRLIWRDDVDGICPSPDMCFAYGDHVRCGPCAIKQSLALGVEPDMSLPNLPEVYRLRREIERLTAQLAEARQAERAAEDRAWEQARDLVRGTNADMRKTAWQAYHIITTGMTDAVNNRQLRTLEGRVEAHIAARKTGEPA